jgi:hypothetical protein
MPKKKRKSVETDSWREVKLFLIMLIKMFKWILLIVVFAVMSVVFALLRFYRWATGVKKKDVKNKEKKEGNMKIKKEVVVVKKTASVNYKAGAAKFDSPIVTKTIEGNYSDFNEKINNDSLIILIFGKRGSGKSSLGFRILENIHSKSKRRCFVFGISQEILPSWIRTISDVEKVPRGGVVLIDEGAIAFGARDSMSSKNKELGKLMAIARHKDLTLIFITQNTGMIDKNIIALTDTLLIKEGSLLQMEMERPEIKKFYEKSNNYIKEVTGNKKKFVYVIDNDFEGTFTYNLPSFWSEEISKNRG